MRLEVRLPPALAERLEFVRLLDGRPVAEWVRAVVLEALGRLLVERPGWAWARPGAPWWSGGALGQAPGEGAAPGGALAGGERCLVLLDLGADSMPADLDPDGAGAFLVDVVPEGAPVLRRVVVRAVDVLPWRTASGRRGVLPSGSPGAERAAAVARLEAERRSAAERERYRAASGSVDVGPAEV